MSVVSLPCKPILQNFHCYIMVLSKVVVLKDFNLAAGLVVQRKCSKLSVVCSDFLWSIEFIQLLESRLLCVGG